MTRLQKLEERMKAECSLDEEPFKSCESCGEEDAVIRLTFHTMATEEIHILDVCRTCAPGVRVRADLHGFEYDNRVLDGGFEDLDET